MFATGASAPALADSAYAGNSYSVIEHLGRIVWLGSFDPAKCMSMFTAYFDESGSPDEGRVLVVAGYVASVAQWERFDSEWRKVLKEFNVSQFHMRLFAHGRGEFSTWKGDKARRERFLRALVGVIRCTVRHSFSAAVVLKDWEHVICTPARKELVGYPYAFCARFCVAMVHRWAARQKTDTPVKCVFEAGAKHTGKFREMMRGISESPVIAAKADYTPFQAADLVAWEHHKFYTQISKQELSSIRESLKALGGIPNKWDMYDGKALEEFLSRARASVTAAY